MDILHILGEGSFGWWSVSLVVAPSVWLMQGCPVTSPTGPLHPTSRASRVIFCSAMGSRVDAYLPVQRIAQACLQCRYASRISLPVARRGTDPRQGGKNAVAVATGLSVHNVKGSTLVCDIGHAEFVHRELNRGRMPLSC